MTTNSQRVDNLSSLRNKVTHFMVRHSSRDTKGKVCESVFLRVIENYVVQSKTIENMKKDALSRALSMRNQFQ